MGLGFEKRISSKDMMIDRRIRMQGKIIDDEVKDLMINKKRMTLLRLREKKGNVFS